MMRKAKPGQAGVLRITKRLQQGNASQVNLAYDDIIVNFL